MGHKKKKAKAHLSPTKAPFRLFSHSPDIMLTVDQKLRVLSMNRPMEGRQPKRMMGRNSALLFPRGFRVWYKKNMTHLFETAEEVQFQYSTDDSLWWEIRLAPIWRGQRVVEGMILCTNVTERRVLHAQAIRHARLATIGVLAASVAHEINNPNSAILFNASVMSRVWADAQPILEAYFQEHGDFLLGDINFSDARTTVPPLMEEVLHNTRRVERIVDNLKHLAKRDEEDLRTDAVDIHATLQAAIMILNHKIRRHTHAFEFLPGKDVPNLTGNSPQLEQVFINVILNALQALSHPDQCVRVQTAWHKKEKRVEVVVQNEGNGIAPEHLSRLTEPFFTTRMHAGGTGLGLSISNLIVRKHHGSLTFESVAGKGTTVTIRLPIAPSSQDQTTESHT